MNDICVFYFGSRLRAPYYLWPYVKFAMNDMNMCYTQLFSNLLCNHHTSNNVHPIDTHFRLIMCRLIAIMPVTLAYFYEWCVALSSRN